MLVFSNTNVDLGDLLSARIDVTDFKTMKESFNKRLEPLSKIAAKDRQSSREIIEMCGSWDAIELREAKVLKEISQIPNYPVLSSREDVRSTFRKPGILGLKLYSAVLN